MSLSFACLDRILGIFPGEGCTIESQSFLTSKRHNELVTIQRITHFSMIKWELLEIAGKTLTRTMLV